MPIGGFVVFSTKEYRSYVEDLLRDISEVEIFGSDEKGNIIIVIEAPSSKVMEDIVEKIKGIDGVLNVGAAYLHFEDEIKK